MRPTWVLVLLAFATNAFAESFQCDGVDVSVQYKEMDPPSASGWEQVKLRVSKDNKPITKQYEYVHFKIGCWANPKGKQYIVYQAYCGGSASYCNHENNWGIIDPVLTKALLDPSPDNRRKAETIFGGTLRWEQWSEQSGARPNLAAADASRGGLLRDSFAGPTLLVDGKSVTYRKAPEGAALAQFQFETKGYRNTYTLDCSRRQFLWTNNVELATGQSTSNTVGAQWRPITGDSKVAREVFLAVCNELGITGSLDEIFPTRDFADVLDRTDCVDRCEVAVGGWRVELSRVVADDRGTPAFTLTDAGGQCGMGGCKALFLRRGDYWDHVFEVAGTLFDVLPTRTNGLADLRVRTLGDAGWTNVRHAWNGKQYLEARKRDQQSEDRTAGPSASGSKEPKLAGKAIAAASGRGANGLVEAAASGDLATVDQLIGEGADVNAVAGKDTDTALIAASRKGHLAVVQTLLAKGADVNARGDTSSTALINASSVGHLAVVELLLDKGADVNAKNYYSTPALQLASQNGHVDVVRVLLDRGADVNAKHDLTALMSAAVAGHKEIVKSLLAKGANVDARSVPNGTTALMLAARGGHGAVIEDLLAGGADLGAKDEFGKTAADYAAEARHRAVAERLRGQGTQGPDVRPEVQAAATNGAGSDRVTSKDGNTLAGTISAARVPFKSTFGELTINLEDVTDYRGGTVRLKDGTALKGTFGDGAAEIATRVGKVGVELRDVVTIERRKGSAPAGTGRFAEGRAPPGGSTTSPNAVDLTRAQAAAMIAQDLTRDQRWSQLEIQTAFPGGKDCAKDARRGWPDRHDRRWINRISKTWPDLGNAISAGFFDVIYDPAPECLRAMCLGGSDCNLILRPSAQPYVIATEKDRSGISKPEDIVWLRVHDGVDVSVTGMTQPTPAQGQYVSAVEFSYKLRLSPLGQALSDKGEKSASTGRAVFVLFDDGWRLGRLKLD